MKWLMPYTCVGVIVHDCLQLVTLSPFGQILLMMMTISRKSPRHVLIYVFLDTARTLTSSSVRRPILTSRALPTGSSSRTDQSWVWFGYKADADDGRLVKLWMLFLLVKFCVTCHGNYMWHEAPCKGCLEHDGIVT